MIIKSNTTNVFGSSASIVGSVFLFIGIITLIYTWQSLFVVLIGATLFSNSKTIIDTDKKKVKKMNLIFGFIPFGKWIEVMPNMSLGYKSVSEGFRMNSLSNRHLDLVETKFALILYDCNDMPILTLMKFDTQIDLQIQMEQLSELLNIPI